MGFETLEEAQSAYDELLGEKQALIKKRDELLGKLKDSKTKLETLEEKFGKYADKEDLDIDALLEIKQKYESTGEELKSKYESLYTQDKAKLEARLAAIEQERKAEKEEREKERRETETARLKADAIAELSKEKHRIRNPQQFWKLYGEGQIKRNDEGGLTVEGDYKDLSGWIEAIAEDPDNQHHFKPKGGTGSGATIGTVGGGGSAKVNPWKKETLNLTQQGQILRSNPELAKRLKAEAGAK